MAVNRQAYESIKTELGTKGVQLVAVSKTKPIEDIQALYDLGQRDFGENYVQELVEKARQLPADIHWHFIGHLQTNKVKLIAPFVQLVHGVDSLKLLDEINRQALKTGRTISCLLQVHIAQEETKFGFGVEEAGLFLKTFANDQQLGQYPNVILRGLMGMASFSDDIDKVRHEFRGLKVLFDKNIFRGKPAILSMGMSADYRIAVEEGSNMVRIGSLLFGAR